jgi:hypothetical protein
MEWRPLEEPVGAGLPPTTDIRQRDWPVSSGPKPTLACLFDSHVDTSKQRLRHIKTQRFGGLEVEDQLDLRRPFDRKVSGFRALQNVVNEHCCLARLGRQFRDAQTMGGVTCSGFSTLTRVRTRITRGSNSRIMSSCCDANFRGGERRG